MAASLDFGLAVVGDVEIAENEHIHPGPQIARNSVLGTCLKRFA
jgi:hypothetical protein